MLYPDAKILICRQRPLCILNLDSGMSARTLQLAQQRLHAWETNNPRTEAGSFFIMDIRQGRHVGIRIKQTNALLCGFFVVFFSPYTGTHTHKYRSNTYHIHANIQMLGFISDRSRFALTVPHQAITICFQLLALLAIRLGSG